MKIIKKNELTILVIALMLVTAGYLNYTTNNENTIETSSQPIIWNEEELANIGDAKLVNSDETTEENEEKQEKTTEEKNENTVQPTNEIIEKEPETNDNTITTSSNINNNEYFVKSRLERETMYSQMIESYQKILESTTISSEQKAISEQEINNINKIKNAIMICENLIKTKGFEECVIFVNDKSVNVIIRKDEVSKEDIAQIQNIISRELSAEIENIHITNK